MKLEDMVLISVDDHLIEPPSTLGTSRRGSRTVRRG
jgi:hypothetical protein